MKHIFICLALFTFAACVKTDIPTTGAIHGVVKDIENAQPLVGCSVMLMPTGTTTVTGADGSFHFQDLTPDTYSVEVSCYGYYTNKKSITVGVSDASMVVDILLTKYDPNNRLAELGALKVDGVTFKSARVECEIIEQGSSSVTERGFLYSETPDVTIATAQKQIVKTTEDIFSATLNNLAEETDYYVAAYAINGRGTAYSDVVKFTTGDASSVTAPSNVIYVSVSGNDANDGSAWGKAKKTIKAAIDAATGDKQIWVSAGTFSEIVSPKDGVHLYGGFSGNEKRVDDRTQRTKIFGLDCDDYAKETIVNGFELADEVSLRSNILLENCRMSNNNYKSLSSTGNNITIQECIIEQCNNSNYNFIRIGGTTAMKNCTVRGNKGGIYIESYGASLAMYNCVVTNNKQGIRANGSCALYNCTIANNAEYGVAAEKDISLYNCLVWNNSLSDYYLGSSGGDIAQYSCLVVDSDDNRTVKFKNPSSATGETASDWKSADWSITTGSVCINAGTTLYFPMDDIKTDIAGNPRVNGSSIDIGAYEW